MYTYESVSWMLFFGGYFYVVSFHVCADVSQVHSSALSSADGSAENQMIVESDDFNSLL